MNQPPSRLWILSTCLLALCLTAIPLIGVEAPPAGESAESAPEPADDAPPSAGTTTSTTLPGHFIIDVPPGNVDVALREALHTHAVGLIRLSAGSYTISESVVLTVPLRGAGQAQTTIHYVAPAVDRPPRRDAPSVPAAIALRSKGSLSGLTIAVERPESIGVLVEREGSLSDVALTGGGTGTGLQLGGRLWAERVRIDGFAVGCQVSAPLAQLVAENLTCSGQAKASIALDAGSVAIRRLTAAGTGAAVVGARGTLTTLVEATVSGMPVFRGEAGAGAALQRITATGCPAAVVAPGAPPTAQMSNWNSQSVPQAAQPLGLSVADTPAHMSNPLVDGGADPVALLTDYQPTTATVVSWGKPVQIQDWTLALQQAIDSGKPVVVLPPGHRYFIQGEVVVRGAVRLIDGLGGGLHEIYHGSGLLYRCTITVGEGTASVVELRGLHLDKSNCTIAQRSARTLVLRQIEGGSYVGQAGILHAVDSALDSIDLAPGQQAYLRAVELRSGRRGGLANAGAELWALGLSSWHWTTLLDATGGRSELLGTLVMAGSLRPKDPLLRVAAGASAALGALEVSEFSAPYTQLLVDGAGAELTARGAFAQGLARSETEPGLEQAPGSLIPLLRR